MMMEGCVRVQQQSYCFAQSVREWALATGGLTSLGVAVPVQLFMEVLPFAALEAAAAAQDSVHKWCVNCQVQYNKHNATSLLPA